MSCAQAQNNSVANSNNEDVNSTTEQVELALHATPEHTLGVAARKLSNELPATEQQQQQQHQHQHQQQHQQLQQNEEQELYQELEPETRWERIVRILIHGVAYVSDHIAAGFGLGRQQTAWYRHCYDNPEPHPRGISYLGTYQENNI